MLSKVSDYVYHPNSHMTPGEWPQSSSHCEAYVGFQLKNKTGQLQDTLVLHFPNTWRLLADESRGHFYSVCRKQPLSVLVESPLATTYLKLIFIFLFPVLACVLSAEPHLDCNDTNVFQLNKYVVKTGQHDHTLSIGKAATGTIYLLG